MPAAGERLNARCCSAFKYPFLLGRLCCIKNAISNTIFRINDWN
jgi:hypothetical protein